MSNLPPFTIKDFLQSTEKEPENEAKPDSLLVDTGSDSDGMAPVLGSSTIARAGWKEGVLRVKFKGVKPQIWEYSPVNSELYCAFVGSPSKGKYFSRFIKGNKHITAKRIA